MRAGLLLLVSLASLVALACASTDPYVAANLRAPTANPRTLVVLDSRDLLQSHSAFFQQMADRGHQLTYTVAGEDAIRLEKFGSFPYENLLLLCSSSEDLGEGLSLSSLHAFVDSGRSILMAVDADVSEPMREIASEFGFDIDEVGTSVQDHGAFAVEGVEGLQHELVKGELNPRAAQTVGGAQAIKAPVLFKGVGHIAEASELLQPLLTGSPSAFSFALGSMVDVHPSSTGRDVLLVSTLQTKGNARVVFSGSRALLSNSLFFPVSSVSGNSAFGSALAKWAFHETGVLRARELRHVKKSDQQDVNPQSYRVSDDVLFSVLIEEYNGVSNSWEPFSGHKDVQLEFTMLDPYLRITLDPKPNGVYATAFQVPDVYGVYKFVLSHHRLGYSNLELSQVVSVRPFKHDEYERFIGVAFPYYTSAFTTMAAFFVFGAVFLYQKE